MTDDSDGDDDDGGGLPHPERRDPTTGQAREVWSDDDFLELLEADGPLTTMDVAEALGCEQNTAYRRLRSLREDGQVESVGSQELTWFVSE